MSNFLNKLSMMKELQQKKEVDCDCGCENCQCNVEEEEEEKIEEKETLNENVLKFLSNYQYSNLKYTRKYLIDNYKKDNNFSAPKSIMLKEDFIEQYYETRRLSGTPTFNYDFSQVQGIIYSNRDMIKIFVNEISTKTKKLIGSWKTSIREFLVLQRENRQIRGMLSKKKTAQYIDNDEFRRRSVELFGDHAPGFDKLNYINFVTPVTLKCSNCGEYFSQTPREHLSGTGYCPSCAMKLCGDKKAKSTEDFIKEVESKYGKGVWDFSKTEYKTSHDTVTLTFIEDGNDYTHFPSYFLEGNDPRKTVIYKGETKVENVLNSLEITNFKKQKKISKQEFENSGISIDKKKRVYVDFYLEYNGIKYIIEYNGIQHYKYVEHLHRGNTQLFIDQVNRDKAVREYCKINNILLIEIPYTYKTFDKIKTILEDIFIKNISIDSLIIIPEIEEIKPKPKVEWSDPKFLDEIKKKFLAGKTYAELAREYDRDPSRFRKSCIKAGLDIYYNETQKKKEDLKNKEILEKHLSRYAYKDLPHTRKYLISQLKKDPNYQGPGGLLLKEDFINLYYKTRKEAGKPFFKYDFSQVPDIIEGRYQRLKIYVNETSTKTGKLIGEWETNVREFITNCKENRVLAGMLSKTKTSQYIDNNEFIKRSKSLFGDHAPGFDKLNYVNQRTPVTLKCSCCGEYFTQMPGEHFSGTGYCPDCAMKKCGAKKTKTTEDFIKEVEEKYGTGVWDFSKTEYKTSQDKVTLIFKEDGKEYTHYPSYFLEGKDPRNSVLYKGESIVENVLNSIGITDFEKQRNIKKSQLEKVGLDRENRQRITVDFYLEYNGLKYIIEYNGIQHYKYVEHLHRYNPELFSNQLKRDELLKRYCKSNNILLIEIPYTYTSFNKIKTIIESIFINSVPIDSVIIIPKIEKSKDI